MELISGWYSASCCCASVVVVHFGSMVLSPEMSKLASVPQTLNFGNNLSFDDDDDIPMNMPGVSPLLNSSNSTSSVSSAVEAKI